MLRRLASALVGVVALAGLAVQWQPPEPPAPVVEPAPATLPDPPAKPAKRPFVSDPRPEIGLIARIGDGRLRHCGNVNRIAFHPNGKWVAAAADGENGMRLWDTTTGEQLRRFTDPHFDPQPHGISECRLVLFIPTGRLVVGTGDGRVVVFELDTGKVVSRFRADYLDEPGSLGLSADSRRVAGFAPQDRTVAVWNLDTGERIFTGPRCEGKRTNGAPSGSPCFSPDGTKVAVCKTAEVVWYAPLDDPAAGREVKVTSAEGGKEGLRDLKWTADHRLRAHVSGGSVVVDAVSGKVLSTDPEVKYPGGPHCLANAAGTRGVRAEGHGIRVFDLTSGHLHDAVLSDIERQRFGPSQLILSANGSRLATAHGVFDTSGSRPKLLDDSPTAAMPTPNKVLTPVPRHGAHYGEPVSPDGTRCVTGGYDRYAVRRTDPKAEWVVLEKYSGVPPACIPPPPPCPRASVFHPDGRLFALRDNRLLVWDADPEPFAKPRSRPLDPDHPAAMLTISPDGRRLGIVTNPLDVTREQVRVLETATLAEVFRFTPDNGVAAASFDAKGRLVVAHQDCTVSIWDADRLEANAVGSGDATRWADPDAKEGVGGVRALAADPERAVAVLAKLAEMTAPQRVAALVADLGSRDFATRERATRALAELGADAEAALREAAESEILEVSDRAEKLLRKLTYADGRRSAAQLRATRAVEVLERAKAKELLAAWAKQSGDPFLRDEAKAAVGRLGER